MKKLEKILSSKLNLFLIAVIAFISYILPVLLKQRFDHDMVATWVSIAYGFMIALLLILSEDITPGFAMTLFYAFTISSSFELDTQPIYLIIAIVFAVVGYIGHNIVYKVKLKPNVYSLSLLFYTACLAVGGIKSKSTETFTAYYAPWMSLALGGIGILAIYITLVVSNSKKANFNTLAYIFTLLGLIIILEEALFIYRYDGGLLEYAKQKVLWLGWGNSNTIAINLMFCIPFAIYGFSRITKPYKFFYLLMLLVESVGIVFTFSRGAVLASLILIPTCTILFAIPAIKKTEYIISMLVSLALISVGVYLTYKYKHEFYEDILNVLKLINTDTMNGRKTLYDKGLELFKANKLFGVGLFASGKTLIDVSTVQFFHDTFLQVAVDSGIIGLILFFGHMMTKYIPTFRKMNADKLCVLFAFIIPGAYGLIDVTYLAPSFMVQLVFLMGYVDLSDRLKGNSKKLVKELIKKNMTISFAESCTGGMLASTIVGVADASKVLAESYVTYSNESKTKILDVNYNVIDTYNVVSEEVAKEMCVGLHKETNANVCVSVTGLAGPTGGTKDRPVGTVCFGFNINGNVETITKHFDKTTRNEIRRNASEFVLQELIKKLGDETLCVES